MRIDLIHPGYMPLQDRFYESPGVGGNESSFILASRAFARRGHDVRVFADCEPETVSGVRWRPLRSYRPGEERDSAIFWVNTGEIEPSTVNAAVRAVKLGGRHEPPGLREHVEHGGINLLIAVSSYLRDLFVRRFGFRPDDPWLITTDGVDWTAYADQLPKVPGKCLHSAVPYRGIDCLLDLWPRIHAAVPHATLWVTSSYLLWGESPEANAAKTADLYRRMADMSSIGVHNLVRLPKPELVRHQLTSQLYLYPTDYEEMCCIAALEAAAAGNAVVASDVAALRERVVDGHTGYLVEGDSRSAVARDTFVERTVALLRQDGQRERFQQNARVLAQREAYDRVLHRWEDAMTSVGRESGRPDLEQNLVGGG